MKIIHIVILAGFLLLSWGSNNYFLNKVSESDKLLNQKEKDLDVITRQYDSLMMEYDKVMDLEKIRKSLEKDGMKTTREINYFKINDGEQ